MTKNTNPELKDLLEARLLVARSNPEAGVSWDEIKARLLSDSWSDMPTGEELGQDISPRAI